MEAKPLRFIRRGAIVALDNVPPDRTLLELLREDLGCTGTKEGCGEGDCGACTVVLGEQAENGSVAYRAINSCIRLAHSIDGMALWSVEDIAPTGGGLHPAQEAMVACHGSQCGFCTPGFVMSLFAMYQEGGPFTREAAQEKLSGNLCRCTGYRPILDAAMQMGEAPRVEVDEAELKTLLQLLRQSRSPLRHSREGGNPVSSYSYLRPESLDELVTLRSEHPHAQLVAGCTDAGLWVTKMHKRFAQVLDVTQVRELRRIEQGEGHVAIGAAVPLQDAFDALVAARPQLRAFANRFAGLPIRNSGTLGGNVANGSPIGDSMPLLIALGATVVLMSARGRRELALEDFYTGYRKNVLAPDEVLAWINVPHPSAGEFMRAYKVSKRFDDDISAVCLAMSMRIDGGKVQSMSIGAGGVAATPVRAVQTESLLAGSPWHAQAAGAAAAALQAEFAPISDMRASAAYRSAMLASLMQRFWLESSGDTQAGLECFVLENAQ